MKNTIFITLFLLLFVSCEKDDGNGIDNLESKIIGKWMSEFSETNTLNKTITTYRIIDEYYEENGFRSMTYTKTENIGQENDYEFVKILDEYGTYEVIQKKNKIKYHFKDKYGEEYTSEVIIESITENTLAIRNYYTFVRLE